MGIRFIQGTYIMLIVISCVGCTTSASQHHSPISSGISLKQRQKTLTELTTFRVKGKVGFIHNKTGGNASIDWQQAGTYYAIRLYGPLGSESVSIRGGPKRITLTRSNGRRLSASSPEILILQELGYEIPVSGLQYWLKGIPAPGKLTHAPTLDAQGRLLQLEQQGWIIRYIAYKNDGGLSLPQKIQLERHKDKNNQADKLKFVFQKWTFKES